MKNSSKHRPKADIRIIKTESLQKTPETAQPQETGSATKPTFLINILGRQQLREQFSAEELQAVVEQIARELAPLALPIILQAQQARQAGRIDEAVLTLRRHARRFATSSEIEQELRYCLNSLAEEAYFQQVTNGQLATILFDVAGFKVVDRAPIKDVHDYLETRLTIFCEDYYDLSRTLEITGYPWHYYCYCLAESERSLDHGTLSLIWDNFDRRERTINSLVHFLVCKMSNAEANRYINVHRFSHNVITIPLERAEMRRAILNETSADYLQGKVSAWLAGPMV